MSRRVLGNQLYMGRPIIRAQVRLPILQELSAPLANQFRRSMMTRDALRMAKTTASNRVALGYLTNPQSYILEGPGYPNAAASMAGGLRLRNAPRTTGAGRGASAGVGVGQ